MTNYLTVSLSLLLFISCSAQHVNKKIFSNQESSTGEEIQPTDALDWTTLNTKVLITCTTCHASSVKPNLITRDDYRIYLQLVLSEVQSDSMPPINLGYDPLTPCQKSLLNEWVNQGGPELTNLFVRDFPECQTNTSPIKPNEPPPIKNPQPTYIDWNLINTKVVNSCTGCHSSKYNTFTNAKKRINSISSSINNDSMPPKSPLTKCQKRILKAWIDAGTPMSTTIPVSNFPDCGVL
jgi:hypothetical protein